MLYSHSPAVNKGINADGIGSVQRTILVFRPVPKLISALRVNLLFRGSIVKVADTVDLPLIPYGISNQTVYFSNHLHLFLQANRHAFLSFFHTYLAH